MKKYFLLCFLKCLILPSQNPKVGNALANYFPISTSFKSIMKATGETIYYKGADSLMIDLDADSKMDLMIKSEYLYRQTTKVNITQCINLFAGKDVQVVIKADKNRQVVDTLPSNISLTNLLQWSASDPTNGKGVFHTINYLEKQEDNAKKTLKYGIDNGTSFIGFRKLIQDDTIYGWIEMNLLFPGEILGYSYECVGKTVALEPTSIISPSKFVCKNSDLTLNFIPDNGIILGRAMKGRTFNPAMTQRESENIYYTAANAMGCPNTASISIEIKPVPEVIIDVIRENKDSVIFSTKPEGGVFEGYGLTGNVFLYSKNPTYNVRYTYTDSFGCQSSIRISNKFSESFLSDNKISSSKNAKVKTPFYWEFLVLVSGAVFALLYFGLVSFQDVLKTSSRSVEDYAWQVGFAIFFSMIIALFGVFFKKENDSKGVQKKTESSK